MKKIIKHFLLLLFLVITIKTFAQRDYFTNLKDFGNGIYALPNSESAKDVKIIDREYVYPAAFVKLYPNQKEKILVAFCPGETDEPTFIFYRQLSSNNYEYIDEIGGDKIFIPGNGNVYVIRRTMDYFERHIKYRYTSKGFKEVPQDLYYVNLKTKTLKNITLYSDYECTKPLAVLPAKSKVIVVANRGDKFLIKTPFGLLGWWKLDTPYFMSKEIEGIGSLAD